jgi:hypothetical protein
MMYSTCRVKFAKHCIFANKQCHRRQLVIVIIDISTFFISYITNNFIQFPSLKDSSRYKTTQLFSLNLVFGIWYEEDTICWSFKIFNKIDVFTSTVQKYF